MKNPPRMTDLPACVGSQARLIRGEKFFQSGLNDRSSFLVANSQNPLRSHLVAGEHGPIGFSRFLDAVDLVGKVIVPAQAQIHCQSRANAPGILEKERELPVLRFHKWVTQLAGRGVTDRVSR